MNQIDFFEIKSYNMTYHAIKERLIFQPRYHDQPNWTALKQAIKFFQCRSNRATA